MIPVINRDIDHKPTALLLPRVEICVASFTIILNKLHVELLFPIPVTSNSADLEGLVLKTKNASTRGHIISHLNWKLRFLLTFQFSSVTQSCPTLCDPMDCSTPGLPVHHQFPEFTQTHVHRVSDAIQPSHPLPSFSPPAFNLFQHQVLYKVFILGSYNIDWGVCFNIPVGMLLHN